MDMFLIFILGVISGVILAILWVLD